MGAGWANVKRRNRKIKKNSKNTLRKKSVVKLSKSKQKKANKNT